MPTLRSGTAPVISANAADASATVRTEAGIIPANATSTIRTSAPVVTADQTTTTGGTCPGDGSIMQAAAMAAVPWKQGDQLQINAVVYSFEKLLSQSSGEAQVFLLRKDEEQVVFKLYYPNATPKDSILKRLVELHHEDIVNVRDYGDFNGRFYEIQDYAAGGTLLEYLPVRDADHIRQIVAEVVNAYKFCHEHDIIHKDIKPENLYFKNADGSDVLIGDFGISSQLDAGMTRHQTSQSMTCAYAAPEMYGILGKAIVGKEVDYFALGMSVIHIWLGESPFKGLTHHKIANLITTGMIDIPDDLPGDLLKLVQGLITSDYTRRWGYDQVQRWLRGEEVPVYYERGSNNPIFQFGEQNGKKLKASTTEALVELMKQHPDRAKKLLYGKKISAWIYLLADHQKISEQLEQIVEEDYPTEQDAGLKKAIFMLSPQEAFITPAQTRCNSIQSFADAMEQEEPFFLAALQDRHHDFYLYLEAHGDGVQADTFRRYFSEFAKKRALHTIILELRGRNHCLVCGERFAVPAALLKSDRRDAIKNCLLDNDSIVQIWLEGIYKSSGRSATLVAFVKDTSVQASQPEEKRMLCDLLVSLLADEAALADQRRLIKLLTSVAGDHPALKLLGEQLLDRVSRIVASNTSIARQNSKNNAKPLAELTTLLLLPLGIALLPVFKIIPQNLLAVVGKMQESGAGWYLAGLVTLAASAMFVISRRTGWPVWVFFAGLIGSLLYYYQLAPWALALVATIYPASLAVAALFAVFFFRRYLTLKKTAHQANTQQHRFDDNDRLAAYRDGARQFLALALDALPVQDWLNGLQHGSSTAHPDPERLATDTVVPELAQNVRMLAMRTGIIALGGVALIGGGKYLLAGTEAQLVEKGQGQMQAIEQARQITGTVTAEATLRQEPTAKSKAIIKVPKRKTVTILERKSDWSRVRYDGREGYIKNSLLKVAR